MKTTVDYTEMTDEEIDAKAADLRKMGYAEFAHADESDSIPF